MEGEKVIQQPEVILPVSKKMLRKPINQVGKALQSILQVKGIFAHLLITGLLRNINILLKLMMYLLLMIMLKTIYAKIL
jgi:hypothetical protein